MLIVWLHDSINLLSMFKRTNSDLRQGVQRTEQSESRSTSRKKYVSPKTFSIEKLMLRNREKSEEKTIETTALVNQTSVKQPTHRKKLPSQNILRSQLKGNVQQRKSSPYVKNPSPATKNSKVVSRVPSPAVKNPSTASKNSASAVKNPSPAAKNASPSQSQQQTNNVQQFNQWKTKMVQKSQNLLIKQRLNTDVDIESNTNAKRNGYFVAPSQHKTERILDLLLLSTRELKLKLKTESSYQPQHNQLKVPISGRAKFPKDFFSNS